MAKRNKPEWGARSFIEKKTITEFNYNEEQADEIRKVLLRKKTSIPEINPDSFKKTIELIGQAAIGYMLDKEYYASEPRFSKKKAAFQEIGSTLEKLKLQLSELDDYSYAHLKRVAELAIETTTVPFEVRYKSFQCEAASFLSLFEKTICL